MGASRVSWKKGSRFRAELDCSQQFRYRRIMTPMIPSQLRMLLIRVAIVCGPGGDALADSLEDLLSEERRSRPRDSSITLSPASSRMRPVLAIPT